MSHLNFMQASRPSATCRNQRYTTVKMRCTFFIGDQLPAGNYALIICRQLVTQAVKNKHSCLPTSSYAGFLRSTCGQTTSCADVLTSSFTRSPKSSCLPGNCQLRQLYRMWNNRVDDVDSCRIGYHDYFSRPLMTCCMPLHVRRSPRLET